MGHFYMTICTQIHALQDLQQNEDHREIICQELY